MSAVAQMTHEPAKSTASDTKRSGRIVQIHPTLRCNLACAHCYSSSAPGGKDGLSAEDLKPFLAAAREQGYDVVSLSGGEPFLYRDLEKLVDFAKSLDFKVNTATNGMLFGSERAKRILEKLDVIAISIDGQPELHDLLRLSAGAFDKMLEGIEVMQKMQKQFGLIHCVTPKSWEQLFWLGEFAYKKGASLLQLHPLEMSGRATETLGDWKTDQMLLHRAWIMGQFLVEKYQESMFVQLDWFHKRQIEQDPNGVWSYPNSPLPTDFSEWLPILNVRETGMVTPLCYGFSDHFSLGNVRNVASNPHFFNNFREKKGDELAALFEKVWFGIVQDDENDLIPWSELIEHESHQWAGEHIFA
jgi:Fe-coproporphyrin III synthase